MTELAKQAGLGVYDTKKMENERSRLNDQAAMNKLVDETSLRMMIENQIEKGNTEIIICEHGGSSLETRESIFELLNEIAIEKGISIKYYNFEYNAKEVDKARQYEKSGRWPGLSVKSFTCDLAKTSGVEILQMMGNKKANILLSSYVMQHIGTGIPVEEADYYKEFCIEQMQYYMDESADFFVRCPDDTYKIYDKDFGFDSEICRQYAKTIVETFCETFRNASNRFYGRKIEEHMVDHFDVTTATMVQTTESRPGR